MNRLFRFVFGPIGFFVFILGYLLQYMKFAASGNLIGQVCAVLCAIYFLAGLPTLLALVYKCFNKEGNSALSLWRVACSAFAVNVLMHGSVKLWLWLALQPHVSFDVFTGVIALTILAVLLLPFLLISLVRAFGEAKKKEKVGANLPTSVRVRKIVTPSGNTYEETISFFGKKSKSVMKLCTD